MLPSLTGRIHTRITLFIFVGLPITFLWAAYLGDWAWPFPLEPFYVLGMIFIVGLILDPAYMAITVRRWEHDWPFAYQAISMIFEFCIVLGLIWLDVLPFLPASLIARTSDFWDVVIHFSLVFFVSFLGLLAFIQVFMIRWRFNAGQWGRM